MAIEIKGRIFPYFPAGHFVSHLLFRTNCKFLQSSCCPLINDHVCVRWCSEWFRYSLVAPGEVGLTLTSLALLLLGNRALMKLFHFSISSLSVCKTIFAVCIIRRLMNFFLRKGYLSICVKSSYVFLLRRLFDSIHHDKTVHTNTKQR